MARQDNDAGRSGGTAATDILRDAGGQLFGAVMQRATSAATDRISNLSDRLTDVSENGESLRSVVRRRDRDDEDGDGNGDDDDGGSGIGSAFGGLKDKVKDLFGGGKGGGGQGGKKLKVTNIVETLDVGLPLRTTYNLWTQYTDFASFMKKVENVDQESDEKTHWKAQVFLSHREWEATTVEQVPDSHIVWRSKGAKGHVDGAVAFTELGPNLTRVMLVMEYFPQGFFERTGNLWRAQGRRARLEFKHFRRHAMTQALLHPDEIEGWRGEIRDSEVVKTHEEALEEEQSGDEQDFAEDGEGEAFTDEADEDTDLDEGEFFDEDLDDEDVEPVDEEDLEDEEELPGEDEDYEPEDSDYADMPEDVDELYADDEEPPARGRRRREPVGAGRGRRGGNS